MFKALTGRQPEDEDELEVLAGDSHTYSIQYVFEASSHSTNLTVRRPVFLRAAGASASKRPFG